LPTIQPPYRNEGCENVLPSHGALNQSPPRSKFSQFVPIILGFVFAIFTSTLGFWCGRKWDATSRPCSWTNESINYCKRAPTLVCPRFTDILQRQSWKISHFPAPQNNSMVPPQRKHLPTIRKSRSRRRVGVVRRQLSCTHHPLLPRTKVRPRTRPSEDQPKIRWWLPRERRRTAPSALLEPLASKCLVQLRLPSRSRGGGV
jgi:hypothetical protein